MFSPERAGGTVLSEDKKRPSLEGRPCHFRQSRSLPGLFSAGLGLQLIEPACHSGFNAGGCVFVHGAGRGEFIEFAYKDFKFLLGGFRIAGCCSGQNFFPLGFDHALAGTINGPAFFILPYSFFGR
jgi:hypothetical protein